ncbi:MAG: class I SAM-dependent methyltransferase [Patescibacteria group bacterium]
MNSGRIFAESYDWEYRNKKDDLEFYQKLAGRLGGPILECGCGTGRIALAMAEKGSPVVGVDIDPYSLQIMKKKIKKINLGSRCSAICDDITKLDANAALSQRMFKMILFSFDIFSYLFPSTRGLYSTKEDVQKVQRSVLEWSKRHLDKNGVVVIDVFGLGEHIEPYVLRHHYTMTDNQAGIVRSCFSAFQPDQDPDFFQLHFFIEEIKNGAMRKFHRMLRGYRQDIIELKNLAESVGLEITEVYDNISFRPCKLKPNIYGAVIIFKLP